MPVSPAENIQPVIEFLRARQPRRILEVGVGHGKYGVLIREYLDVAHERYTPSDWQVELIGIEVFEKYRCPLWDYAYNQVLVEDVRRLDLAALGPFDCGLLLDVIEHFEHEEGRALLERLLDACECVIVSTPREFVPQGAVFNNEHERHRSLWRRSDFRSYHCQYRHYGSSSVAVLSRLPLTIRLGQESSPYFRFRRLLLRTLPGPAVRFLCSVKGLARALRSAAKT